MADGLLTSILGAIDRQKQATQAGLGLLVSNPMEFARSATARYFPTPEEVAQQRALEQSGGMAMNTPYMDKMFNLAQFQGSIKPTGLLGVPMAPAANNQFNIVARDASDIFGAGAQRVMYTDPNSGGFIDVLVKPDKTASVMNLLVPEKFRGQKIGESLQAQALKDFPELSGQVSKKAAAKTAYRLGRRPPYMPDASLDDVFKIIDENSSVNLVSPEMQKRFK